MGKQGSKRQHAPSEPQSLAKIPTCIAGPDDILEGGFPAGRITLISGGPGTGKTMRGVEFLYKSALAGHEGNMIMPEAMGAEQHLIQAMSRIKALEPQHVVIDAISALQRIGGEKAAFDYLMRLVDFAKQQGITVLMTNQLAGNFEQIDFSGVGFSSLLDTIILLRFVEIYNKITRSLLILKSRGTKHSNSYHRFVITDHGIEMTTIPSGARLSELQGQPSTGRSHAEAGVRNGGEQ